VFTTSLGLEDQAIAHAIFAQDLAIDVVTLDTGRLFPETYQLWVDTERRYGRRIRALAPDHLSLEALVARQGIDGFRASIEARRACCAVRKVAPLARALAGASGWITGLRAEQSADRALLDFAVADDAHGVVKVNPLFDWTRDRVVAFVRAHDVPYNPLHDRGFLSIGCAPCTRAVAPGEPERAGRWWWEQEDKKECGLHRNAPRAAAASPSPAQVEKV
jgi:phosphoadenosine phosphosulfate reductase